MTFGELKTAVDALGGQNTDLSEAYPNLEQSGDQRFCSIVTRAINEINLIRPRTSEARIFCRAPRTLYSFSEPRAVRGELSIPTAGGKAVTFEYKGVGSYKNSNGVEYQLNSPYEFKRISFALPDTSSKGEIVFIQAAYMFTVRNVAVYDELISKQAEDIPEYAERILYTVEASDFATLSPSSISLEDKTAYGIEIRDNRYISVPWSVTADIAVRYQRKLKPVSLGAIDTDELDLDDDLAKALLPTLVASYVFYDPTDSASVYFRQIYESDRANLVSKIHNADASRIYSTNNW